MGLGVTCTRDGKVAGRGPDSAVSAGEFPSSGQLQWHRRHVVIFGY